MSENNVRVWSFRGLLKGNLLAFSLLFLGAHASLAQVATADLPGNPTPVGGVGTQEISEADVEDFNIPTTPEPTCDPTLNTVKSVELGDKSLVCTGQGSQVVDIIKGNNGEKNKITLSEGAKLTVTGLDLDECDPANKPENKGPVSIALDCTGSGGNKDGNKIDISAGSALVLAGKLTFHSKGESGNPDVIINAGTLKVGGNVDLYQYSDTFTNSGNVDISGKFALGSGDDKIDNSGKLEVGENLNTKLGADSIVNSGELTVGGDLSEVDQGTCGGGGAGDNDAQCGKSNSDSIENSGNFIVKGNIILGSSGEKNGNFENWADNDSIVNSGTLSAASIQFEKKLADGSDFDVLENTGTLNVDGNILFGRDVDVFKTDV